MNELREDLQKIIKNCCWNIYILVNLICLIDCIWFRFQSLLIVQYNILFDIFTKTDAIKLTEKSIYILFEPASNTLNFIFSTVSQELKCFDNIYRFLHGIINQENEFMECDKPGGCFIN